MARFRPAAPLLGALAAMLLLVAGCTTPTEPAAKPATPAPVTGGAPTATGAPVVTPPSPAAPVAPAAPKAPVIVAKPASITGSEETSTMFDNYTAYIAYVDGQLVAAGRLGWNTPISLPAGPHKLTVAFNRGVFTAKTDVHLNARAEAVYQLKFASDAEIFGKNSYCEFWIVDTATDQPACERVRAALARIDSGK